MTSLKTTDDLAIPQGSLILVTGTTGYIGANIVQEALDAGFKVRGTVRSQDKADKSKKLFHNNPNYETVLVPDMQPDGAYDEAVKGVDAVIHVASVLTFSADPSEVVPPTVQAALGIMKSALKEPKVKRFVYTSSSVAACFPKPNTKFHIGTDTWNHEAEQYVNLDPPFDEKNGFFVYGASKFKAEQAVWNFVKEHKPQYVVNAVLPNFNMGRIIGSPGVTGIEILNIWKGKISYAFDPQYMIDVVDDARIHLAAAIDKTVANQRIYAFDSTFSIAEVVEILKELRPDHQFPTADKDEGRDLSTVDNEPGAKLLKKWFGQDGYTGLRQAVANNIADESWLQ